MTFEPSQRIVSLSAVGRDCAYDLHDPAELVALAKAALALSGASLVAELDHVFVPHGVTIVLIAAQSHLVLSTWPEVRAATLDVALCGQNVDPLKAWMHLASHLQPAAAEVSTVRRSLE